MDIVGMVISEYYIHFPFMETDFRSDIYGQRMNKI